MTLHTSGASSIAATNNGAAVTPGMRHAHCCKALNHNHHRGITRRLSNLNGHFIGINVQGKNMSTKTGGKGCFRSPEGVARIVVAYKIAGN